MEKLKLIDLLIEAKKNHTKFYDFVIDRESNIEGISKESLIKTMTKRYEDIMESVQKGNLNSKKSFSGLSGGDAKLMREYIKEGKTVCGTELLTAVTNSIAVSEYNASMGRIVACPTAGSSGIVPGVLVALKEQKRIDDELLVKGLFTAGEIGRVIAINASVSGAEGGCQAECGSAAAMAACLVVDILGNEMERIDDALAIALKNVMGLICDPVAGLVEVPCVKRNAIGVTNALLTADMVMAGIKSKIPGDEVIEAMNEVSKNMLPAFKETGDGGIANTKTGRKISKMIFG